MYEGEKESRRDIIPVHTPYHHTLTHAHFSFPRNLKLSTTGSHRHCYISTDVSLRQNLSLPSRQIIEIVEMFDADHKVSPHNLTENNEKNLVDDAVHSN